MNATAELCVVDADGDSIRFVLNNYTLEEWITPADGSEPETCAIAQVTTLDIDLDNGQVRDDDGVIPFPVDQMHKLESLETLALAAGLEKKP